MILLGGANQEHDAGYGINGCHYRGSIYVAVFYNKRYRVIADRGPELIGFVHP